MKRQVKNIKDALEDRYKIDKLIDRFGLFRRDENEVMQKQMH